MDGRGCPYQRCHNRHMLKYECLEQSSMFNYLGIHFHISRFIQADTSALVNFSVSIDTFDRILLYKTD